MAYHYVDSVLTKSFTPKEPQVELFETACKENVIVSLINATGKNFICCKAIEHFTNNAAQGKVVLYLAASPAMAARQAASVRRLTCCSVAEVYEASGSVDLRHQVLVTTVELAVAMFESGVLAVSQISLLILNQCHRVNKDSAMRQLMVQCAASGAAPHTLGLAGSLLRAVEAPHAVETEVALVEATLQCAVDTASDSVTVLQYGARPRECLLEFAPTPPPHDATQVLAEVEREVRSALEFLHDHQFEVCEYDGFEQDILTLPDPKAEPLALLAKFLSVLHTLGLYAADKAAYTLISQIERLKVRTPYERHYLLLCLVSSVFIKIRAILDYFFQYKSDRDKIFLYSGSKILRLFDAVRQFRIKTENNTDTSQKARNNVEESLDRDKSVGSSQGSEQVSKCQLSSSRENLAPSGPRTQLRVHNRACKCNSLINFLLQRLDDPTLQWDPSVAQQPTQTNLSITFNVDNGPHMVDGSCVPGELRAEGGQAAPTGPARGAPDNRGFRKARSDWQRGRRGAPLDPMRAYEWDPHALCGLVLVDDDFTARVLFYLFCDLKNADDDFSFLRLHFTVELCDELVDAAAQERAYRNQELVLKNFRMRECNLLIGTSFLESGIDLPRCNLVVRFDAPRDYRAYAQGKARARGPKALHCMLAARERTHDRTLQLASYHLVEQMLMKKGKGLDTGCEEEEEQADRYCCLLKPFCPSGNPGAPYVTLSSAIALLNRYCAKLPSDTFTRLTALSSLVTWPHPDGDLYACTIRLPINSPIKRPITGPVMRTAPLARRFAALQTCLALQAGRELDDSLLPISKETFWLREEELIGSAAEDAEDQALSQAGLDARPGTTKRRQYYNKRTAESLMDCRPVAGEPCRLYHIAMSLSCPLPEEQNTRGREIRAPEDSPRGFGVLTARHIPAVGAFPIFTRAGEVSVELALAPCPVVLTHSQIEKIVPFINFTFTSVLRLQKYLMMFDPDTSENAYFVVPTIKGSDGLGAVRVDWDFLDLIYETRNQVPQFIPDEDRANFKFEPDLYVDAVVCPWYRNQDQPQYFYVAEMCHHLTPRAAFPGTDYGTFEEYYLQKYGIQVQNTAQALLDVDHTSARLNFLTPRYVNRKGVALPTTSEAKKRAKRENLGQKQILVPELCNVHPFPASLWQKAVCLPCILHRLNALLLADEVRRLVAQDLGLGHPGDPAKAWQPLDFGWNLADVLSKSRLDRQDRADAAVAAAAAESTRRRDSVQSVDSALTDSIKTPWMEVGTWSNDLADELPANVTMLTGELDSGMGWDSQPVRYGSPTSWVEHLAPADEPYDSMSDVSLSDSDDMSDDALGEDSGGEVGPDHGLRIEFKDKDVAEAVEQRRLPAPDDAMEDVEDMWDCGQDESSPLFQENKRKYEVALGEHSALIAECGVLCPADEAFVLPWSITAPSVPVRAETGARVADGATFGTAINATPQLVDDWAVQARELPHAPAIRQSLLKYRALMELRQVVGRRGRSNDSDCPRARQGSFKLEETASDEKEFGFDAQPVLEGHPGPSPSLILQALTMSNANDGINLERLETIGDSFLKYAITTFLYCTYDNVHEGKLSHLRSKQVSNLNLYRLGKRQVFAESMVATKFEPHDNWLPPCYFVPRELERALIEAGLPASHWNRADLPALHRLGRDEVARLVQDRTHQLGLLAGAEGLPAGQVDLEGVPSFIPYNLMTQHSIPDKSVADCVEALIGAYLVATGPRGALLFMSWLGIKVLPREEAYGPTREALLENRAVGHTMPISTGLGGDKAFRQTRFGQLLAPRAPLLRHVADPEGEQARLLTGFEAFEDELQYRFRDRSYLLQAVTHASYDVNRLTDCYQRLEFLGDAVLDYLITRHLYEDPRHHSPGSLTDLRSALVNNTIFASLAVRHGFHRFFRHQCPALHEVLDRFVRIQQENNHAISDECYLVEEEDSEQAEDVEVPKSLGDVFESVAGAIFLDSAMSLDAVWGVYYRIMKTEIDAFSTNVPKSPIRELLELEPETAQFGKPEKLADGRRVRVAVEVFGKGVFKGIGRNYRIAKCTAAKCALKQLKRRGLLQRTK